jgi:hypothetical protein
VGARAGVGGSSKGGGLLGLFLRVGVEGDGDGRSEAGMPG